MGELICQQCGTPWHIDCIAEARGQCTYETRHPHPASHWQDNAMGDGKKVAKQFLCPALHLMYWFIVLEVFMQGNTVS